MICRVENNEMQNLEYIAESNPSLFLKSFNTAFSGLEDPEQKNHLSYLQGKALVALNLFTEAEDTMLELLSQAVISSDSSLISKCNLVLSKCCTEVNRHIKEKLYLDIALKAAQKAHDGYMIAESLSQIGAYYQDHNNEEKALSFFAKAEKVSRKIANSSLNVKILMAIGSAYFYFLQYDKALAFFTSALELCKHTDGFERQLIIVNNLAALYTIMNQYDAAIDVLNIGFQLATDMKMDQRRISLLFNLGVIDMRQDKHQAAVSIFEQCLEIAGAINFANPHFLCEIYSNLAGCYRYIGDAVQALNYIAKAESIAKELNNPLLCRQMEVNKTNLLISMGQIEEAKKLLKNNIKYFVKHQHFDLLIIAQNNLAQCHEQMGDYPRALALLKDLNKIYQEYMDKVLADKTKHFHEHINQLAVQFEHAEQTNSELAQTLDETLVAGFVGSSSIHQKVLEHAILASQHPNTSVFITGESGTGKEIIAQFIHKNSVRRSSPFVPINVSAISPGLAESEFFGHTRGAFTGATSDTKGIFLHANNGTVYLDEIADMPIELQAKLLRALESKKVTPVGSTTETPFDCRIICSTNRDVSGMLKRNQFRLDLFHRLNTLEIHIPPLRNRPEDIESITRHYIMYFAKENSRQIPFLKPSFLEKFRKYPFPGNVRELRNIIERLFIMNTSSNWDESVLEEVLHYYHRENPLSGIHSESEKDAIISILKKVGGKQKEAAIMLGISESTLTRRIKTYHLESFTQRGRQ